MKRIRSRAKIRWPYLALALVIGLMGFSATWLTRHLEPAACADVQRAAAERMQRGDSSDSRAASIHFSVERINAKIVCPAVAALNRTLRGGTVIYMEEGGEPSMLLFYRKDMNWI